MKIIGITGSSGSGKTTICKILKSKYNAEIIDADEIAKKLSKKGTKYMQAIVNYFGDGIVDTNGDLKRRELADIIYENEEKRNKLNEFTFFYVVNEIKDNIAKLKESKLIVIDAPLLFESGLDKVCDVVIGVSAKENDKIERICKRDKISKQIAKKRLNIQKNNKYIEEKSDYVIYNEENIKKLEEKIKTLEELGLI